MALVISGKGTVEFVNVIQGGVTHKCTIGKLSSGQLFFEEGIPVTYYLMDCLINVATNPPTQYYIGVFALRCTEHGRLTENIACSIRTLAGVGSWSHIPARTNSLNYDRNGEEAQSVAWQQNLHGNKPHGGLGADYFSITYKGNTKTVSVKRDWRDAPLLAQAKPVEYTRGNLIIPTI